MKTLTIVGSQRNGNSLKISNILKEIIIKNKIENDVIVPGKQDIKFCTGCLKCDTTGKCVFNDDMISNIVKIKEAQIIIFITPTRWNLMSGDIKIFIDRLNPLAVPEILVGKKCIAIAIGQTTKDDKSVEDAIKSIKMFCDSAKIKMIGEYKFYSCLENDDILKQFEEVIKMLDETISYLKQ